MFANPTSYLTNETKAVATVATLNADAEAGDVYTLETRGAYFVIVLFVDGARMGDL